MVDPEVVRRRLREIDRRLERLETSLAERLRSAAGLRNILVHAYLEVDPQILWSNMGHLEDLRSFAYAFQAYLPR